MTANKRLGIADILRDRIRDGHYPAGSRIPSQRVLLAEFKVSPVTLQRAMDLLGQEGFLVARGTAGTFVADKTPDRSRCALIFTQALDSLSWDHFYSTLIAAAEHGPEDRTCDLETWHITEDAASSRTLCERIHHDALAGIIFASFPGNLLTSPLLSVDIPRVAIGDRSHERAGQRHGCSLIVLDDQHMIADLCRGFAASGRKRVAAITPLLPPDVIQSHLSTARKAGLATRPEWWIGLMSTRSTAWSARAITHLLCTGPASERPDCLIITDDNLVPAATAGVRDSGLLLPTDLIVAAHAHFPGPTAAAVGCLRFGHDAQRILAQALDEIGHLRQGGSARTTAVPLTIGQPDESAW